MAGLKISLLNSAGTLSPQDQIPIARNGITLRLPGEAIASRPQLNALAEYAATKAPILSAEHIYTLIGGLSSAVDTNTEFAADTYAPYTFVLDISSFIDSRFVTNLSATNTYIENPSAPSQGQVLTWDDGKWVPRIGVQAVVQSLSGARTLDIASVGTIIGIVGNNPPFGYLLCDGSSVSKLNYPELFDQIGYTYGGVAPGNSFNLPNIPSLSAERPYLSYIKYTQISGLASVTAATSGLISKPTTGLQEGTVLTYRNGAWVAAAPVVPQLPVIESPFKRVFGRTFSALSSRNDVTALRNIPIPSNTYKITIAVNRMVLPGAGTMYMQFRTEDGIISALNYFSSSTANISQTFNVPSQLSNQNSFNFLVGATVAQNTTIKVPQSTGGKRPQTVYVDKVITEYKWLSNTDLIITLVRTGGNNAADSNWVMSHTGRLDRFSVHGAGSFTNMTGKNINGISLSTNSGISFGTMDVYCETMPM